MKRFMPWIYLILTFAGAYFPIAAALPWFALNGFDLPLLISEATSTQAAYFFSQDLMWTAIIVFIFILIEGIRIRLGWRWLLIVPAFCCATSFGLPLFLFFRERLSQHANKPA